MEECKKMIDDTEQQALVNHGGDGRKPCQDVLPRQSESYAPEIQTQHYQNQPDQQRIYQQKLQYYLGTAQYQSPYYPVQMMHPLQMTNWQYDSRPCAAAPTP